MTFLLLLISATVAVDAAKQEPLPETIFGTFLEPIGHSTYGGLWAQILENPSFEENLWSAGEIARMIKSDPDLARASQLGLPLPWEPLDPRQGNRYEPRWGDAANSSRSLYLMGLPDKEAGIRQKVYLPVYRCLRYLGSIYLKGTATVKVSLADASTIIHANSPTWRKYPFTLNLSTQPPQPVYFTVSIEPVEQAVSPAAGREARILLDQVSLYPADAIDGLDPEMIAMSRALKTPLVRFGGNFTSAYHWRDGIGPPDERVSMLNIAWGIPEYNQFGTDEFLDFCRRIGAQPQIALNLGTGTPAEAAEWVRYVNQKWNAGRGGLLWELGNELWGDWQVGYPSIDEVAARTKAFSAAIRAVDPNARLIATGQDPDHYEKWNAAQLSGAPRAFDYLSTHFVVGSENMAQPSPEAEFALPIGLQPRLRGMADQIDSYAWARGRVKIAFTEWLFWAPEDRKLVRYDNMGGAICAGGFLNMLLRTHDIVPIADMTGLIEFGGIWKKKGRVFGVPAYYVFRMYSSTEPRRMVETRTEVGQYHVHEGNRRIPEIEHVPYLDVTAALDASGRRLFLYCVNRSLTEPINANINVAGFKPSGDATVSTIHADSIYDGNSAEQPEAVVPQSSTEAASPEMRHTFPPASVTVITFTASSPAAAASGNLPQPH